MTEKNQKFIVFTLGRPALLGDGLNFLPDAPAFLFVGGTYEVHPRKKP